MKPFVPSFPIHCYQKGYNGNVLFYNIKDRLLYLTIFSTQAKKYGIKTLAINLMFNHVHFLVRCKDKETLILFNATTQQMFARDQNSYIHSRGKWFMKTFGWAQKKSDKDIRTCYCYINNNAVEKQLYTNAAKDPWTLLSYYQNPHPYSGLLTENRSSAAMRQALKEVRYAFYSDNYINLTMLDRFSQSLTQEELLKIKDYIISLYCPIVFEEANRYFGSVNNLLLACNVSSGSEYEIKEDWDGPSDKPYLEMIRSITNSGYSLSDKSFIKNRKELLNLIRILLKDTHASPVMIGRFLHQRVHASPSVQELRACAE